mgnify:CR=1 FL=1
MFILDTNDVGTTLFAKGEKVDSDIDLWHKRISHVNYQRLQELQSKQVVFGLLKIRGQKAQICDVCQFGKQHRLPFPTVRNRSLNKLDLIHLDVWGRAQNVSLGGSRYFIFFIDDYSRHMWIYLIEKKSEAYDCFRNLQSLVEHETLSLTCNRC